MILNEKDRKVLSERRSDMCAALWGNSLSGVITFNPLNNPHCGLPGASDSKEFACNAGDLGLTPGSGRSPGEGNDNLLQHSCLENPMDRGAWRAVVHGVPKKSDTTERRARTHKHTKESDTTERHTHARSRARSAGLWGRIKAFGFDPGS